MSGQPARSPVSRASCRLVGRCGSKIPFAKKSVREMSMLGYKRLFELRAFYTQIGCAALCPTGMEAPDPH